MCNHKVFCLTATELVLLIHYTDRGRVPGISGMYCSGWARRGPTGIIGSNITDARSVASAIVEDIR